MTPEEARKALREFAHDSSHTDRVSTARCFEVMNTVDALLDEMRTALLVALGARRHYHLNAWVVHDE